MFKYFLFLCLFQISIQQSLVNIQPLSKGRAYFAGTSLPLHGLAFFGGGKNGLNVLDDIDIYNVNTNSWTTSQLSLPRQYLTASNLLQGLVFFAGGCDFNCYNFYDRVDIFNANTSKWTTAKLSVARRSAAANSLYLYGNGVIFIAGGAGVNGSSNVVDMYNGNVWTTAQLSVPRLNIATAAISSLGLIFFGGGNDYENNVYATVDYFESNANYWGTFSLTYARTECAATALPSLGLVFFAGGKNFQNEDLNTIEVFNIVNYESNVFFLSVARRSLLAFALPDSSTVYFAGGIQYFGGFIPRFIPVVDYFTYGANLTTNSFFMPNGKAYASGASLPVQNLILIAGGLTGPDAGPDSFFLNNVNIYGGCDIGYFQTINPLLCFPCIPGYNCHFGETIPQPCPQGHYCLSGSMVPCPAGTYGNLLYAKSVNDCKKCPAGTYNSLSGQSSYDSCLPCYTGSYCGPGTPFPKDCPNNYYCPDASKKLVCPPGTFRDTYPTQTVDDCLPCPPGTYCSGNGNNVMPCNPGTYSDKNGSVNCLSCPTGSYCQFGSVMPQICETGTVAPKGSSACTPCESGQYTPGPGYGSCLTCLSSYWAVDNWHCQDKYQKLISVFIWMVTIISGVITVLKIRLFIKKRMHKLRMVNVPVTLKNIVYIDRHINNQKSYFTSLVSRIEEVQNEQQFKNYDEEIKGLKQTIINLKMEIEDMK